MKRALLLVDHGSRREEARAVLDSVAAFVRERSGLIVHAAHLEAAPPTIAEGFEACVRDGAEEVLVHPYFLMPGRHAALDIPARVREAAGRHPGVSWRVTVPLGFHEKIAEVVLERIQQQQEVPCAI